MFGSSDLRNVGSIFVGGAERACSTALYSYLSRHSEIKVFLDKEPSFFNLYDAAGELNVFFTRRGNEAVEDYNRYNDSAYAILDCSPLYLTDPVAPYLIKELVASPKFVFVLRNPLERYLSSMAWRWAQSASYNEHTLTVDKFEVRKSIYSIGLDKYFALFGSENIKVLCFDDFKVDPKKVSVSVNQFLGLQDKGAVISRENQFVGMRRFPWIYRLSRILTGLAVNYDSIKLTVTLLKKTPLRKIISKWRDSFVPMARPASRQCLDHSLQKIFLDEISSLLDRDYISEKTAESWRVITQNEFNDLC